MLSVIEKTPSPKVIYTGYYIDRKALSLTLIQKNMKFELIGLQHGAFNVFPTLYRGIVDRIILMFPFSRALATDFFRFSGDRNIMVAPEYFDFGWTRLDASRPFVVYGASADSSVLNREIVAALDTNLPPDYDVLVKLHPRDLVRDYADLEKGRVRFTERNAINAAAYCGQLSSVIAEAWLLGVPFAVMNGTTARNSDFQLMLGDDVHHSPVALAHAVSSMLTQSVRQ